MNAAYQQLVVTLGKQLAIFSELRTLLDRETDAITEFDADTLEVIAGVKMNLQKKVRLLEDERQILVGSLAELYGVEPSVLSLRELATRAPQPQAEKLTKLRNVFAPLADEIQAKISDNSRRIDRSLWLVRSLRNIITNQIDKPPTYEKIGRGAQGVPPSASGGGRV
jgi:flagellar biosynthesis/type III secretory pathway chaperone